MRSRIARAGSAALLAAALILVPAIPAKADTVNGSRTCPAGKTLTTGTKTGSGYVFHHHNEWVKGFQNTGVQWRYWSKGLRSAWYILDAPGAPLLSYNTACYT